MRRSRTRTLRKRDHDVTPKPFHPAILRRAEPVRVRSLGLEVPKQACINPARTHLRQPYPNGILSIRHSLRDRLPLKLGVATLRLRMQQVTVRVPASTSNLGPGFDCLGVALRIYNDVTVTSGRGPEQPHPQIVSDAAGTIF